MQRGWQDQSDRAEDLGHADQFDRSRTPVCRPAPGWGCDELVFGLNQLYDPAPGECEGEYARDDPQCQIHDDLNSAIWRRVLSGTVISARVPPRTDECAWITPMGSSTDRLPFPSRQPPPR